MTAEDFRREVMTTLVRGGAIGAVVVDREGLVAVSCLRGPVAWRASYYPDDDQGRAAARASILAAARGTFGSKVD